MDYFGNSQKHALKMKQRERQNYLAKIEDAEIRQRAEAATREDLLELFFLQLASRLLRAKFWSVPSYTNEELSYLVGCTSGTYLALIIGRDRKCSRDLALLMHGYLKALEKSEGMPPMEQIPYPDR